MELTAEQGRVLGCLVEKQLTTPQLYPLTENALIAACNQSTNRDPVVAYEVPEVRSAVRSLREAGLLRTVHRTGERSDKHLHLLEDALGLSPAQVALLAVLLLRGPQTLAELRARTERMHAFATVEQVEEALAGMAEREEPLVARLERQPGRKEVRYSQLLVEPGAVPLPEQAPAAVPAAVRAVASARAAGPDLQDLARQVEELRAEVAQLRAEVAELRAEAAAQRGT